MKLTKEISGKIIAGLIIVCYGLIGFALEVLNPAITSLFAQYYVIAINPVEALLSLLSIAVPVFVGYFWPFLCIFVGLVLSASAKI